MNLDPKYLLALKAYGTPTQASYLQAIVDNMGIRPAARKLGLNESTIRGCIKRVAAKAAAQGFAPGTAHDHTIPAGYHIKGVSELVDANGQTKIKWVKTDQDKENLELALTEMLDAVVSRVEGRAKPIPSPDLRSEAKDMAVVVPMGDPHVGMYSWAREAEADWDVALAERVLLEAVEHLIDVSPQAEEFVLINLGDFFHADTMLGTTTKGTPLDTDGRWAKVQEIGFMIMVRCIDRALTKYPSVTVHNAIGNHDEHTSQALTATLNAWYRNEPRVTITRNPSKFWYYQFGNTMIGVHHGHTTQPQMMPLAMATHEPEMWGNTRYRYVYLGHKHHKMVKELQGVIVEQFRTLAPKDAWHHANAQYIAMRDMQSIHIHRKYGEVGRRVCPVAYLERSS